METEPRLKTSSDRLEKPAIESVITCFQDIVYSNYAEAAPTVCVMSI